MLLEQTPADCGGRDRRESAVLQVRQVRRGSCLPLDRWSGLMSGMSTPTARRMLSLAGMSWSFDTASDHLHELCLLKVSNDTIRQVSEAEGEAARQWIARSARPAETFKKACGDQEFYT